MRARALFFSFLQRVFRANAGLSLRLWLVELRSEM